MAVFTRKPSRVMCLHGAGGGGWEWEFWFELLAAAGLDVSAPDLEPADAGIAATTLADYRRQVERLAGEGQVVLVGASMGGWLALAASAAIRPAARVLVNPVPPAGSPGWPPAPRDYPDIVPWRSAPDFQATRDALPDGDFTAQLMAHRHWRDESGAVMRALNRGEPVEPFDAPTLVMAGGRDTDVPAPLSRGLAESLGADYACLAAASHLGPLLGRDAPQAAALALDWLIAVFRGDSGTGA